MLAMNLAKRVAFGRELAGGGEGEILEGGQIIYVLREKGVCWGSLHGGDTMGPFLSLCCGPATKRGFLHLFLQFHAMSTQKGLGLLSKTTLSTLTAKSLPPFPAKNQEPLFLVDTTVFSLFSFGGVVGGELRC